MKTLLIVIVLIGLGYGLAVWMSGRRAEVEKKVEQTGAQVADGVKKATDAVKESLTGDKIRKELEETGKVVRQKASEFGDKVADATADTRATAAVKAHLASVIGVDGLKISVSTTAGRVTLSGAVENHDQLSQIIRAALEVQGVREVVSTIQVLSTKK